MHPVFISAVLATVTFALPHGLRDVTNGTDATPCAGAPALPLGAVPGDPCGSDNSTAGAPSARSFVPRRVVRKSQQKPQKKRDGFSSCETVKIEDYNSSPMKQGIEDLATKNWGKGFTVVVNPSDFPDQNLQFCYSTDEIPATFNGQPQCSSSQNQLGGNVANGTADVTIGVLQGVTSSHAVTTEAAVSLSTATEIGITLGVPAIDEVSVKETVTLTGTFTKGTTNTQTVNSQTTQQVVAHATKPGPCHIQLNVTSCTGEATATVPGFFTGFVWFNYGSRKDGHFKWALNVDVNLPADQRSNNMTLTDKISSSTAGTFTSDCI